MATEWKYTHRINSMTMSGRKSHSRYGNKLFKCDKSTSAIVNPIRPRCRYSIPSIIKLELYHTKICIHRYHQFHTYLFHLLHLHRVKGITIIEQLLVKLRLTATMQDIL